MAKILVVDDSEMARQEVLGLLSGDGHEVIQASHGREGLEKFLATAGLSLIVSDINMPIMDGLSMLEEIAKAAPGHKVPAVIVSSDANVEQKDRGRKVGVLAWVLKPINGKAFISGVQAILQRAAQVGASTRE